MPKPPNHWVIERQRSTDDGSSRTWGKMVAPVEVTPDMASNHAVVKLSVEPVAKKGNVAKSESTNHNKTTNK